MAIAHPTPTVFYSTGGSPPFIADDATMTNTNEPYLDWLEHILNETSIPQTLTTSYGDDEQTVLLLRCLPPASAYLFLGSRGIPEAGVLYVCTTRCARKLGDLFIW